MSDIYKISEAIGITNKAIQNVTNEQIERKMTHCLLKIRIGDKMYEKDEESQMKTRKKLFWLIILISYIDLLFRGYLRQGKRTEALELLQGMREYGCVPLASSYTQLMQQPLYIWSIWSSMWRSSCSTSLHLINMEQHVNCMTDAVNWCSTRYCDDNTHSWAYSQLKYF